MTLLSLPQLLQPDWVAPGTLAELPLDQLVERRIRALVLDVDRTLLPRHGIVGGLGHSNTRGKSLASRRSLLSISDQCIRRDISKVGFCDSHGASFPFLRVRSPVSRR